MPRHLQTQPGLLLVAAALYCCCCCFYWDAASAAAVPQPACLPDQFYDPSSDSCEPCPEGTAASDVEQLFLRDFCLRHPSCCQAHGPAVPEEVQGPSSTPRLLLGNQQQASSTTAPNATELTADWRHQKAVIIAASVCCFVFVMGLFIGFVVYTKQQQKAGKKPGDHDEASRPMLRKEDSPAAHPQPPLPQPSLPQPPQAQPPLPQPPQEQPPQEQPPQEHQLQVQPLQVQLLQVQPLQAQPPQPQPPQEQPMQTQPTQAQPQPVAEQLMNDQNGDTARVGVYPSDELVRRSSESGEYDEIVDATST